MPSTFQELQRKKAINLISDKNPIFNGAVSGKRFMGAEREFVITDGGKNLFAPIKDDVLQYFANNHISWWGGLTPTGHLLSSQTACLNHLFQFREDKDAVLSVLRTVSSDFIDVIEIKTDMFAPAYIQFEAVSDCDLLNEGVPNRGSNCTSVDALIYAVHKDGSKWLIPIEWKYTEFYDNQSKAVGAKGEVRKKRYTELINKSSQLIGEDHSSYYYEPFYQLMRQTLWAEQMVRNKERETLKADFFLHLHIIPSENLDLLEKKNPCSSKNMEDTWRANLYDQSKYKIVSPEKLMSGLHSLKYNPLLEYLKTRYW